MSRGKVIEVYHRYRLNLSQLLGYVRRVIARYEGIINPHYAWFPSFPFDYNRLPMRSQAARKKFLCTNACGSSFTHRGSLTRHLRYECQQNPRFKCPCCDFRSRWTSDVYKHVRKRHEGVVVRCIDIGRN
ncbi:Zinc finger protein Helios [Harpegnathos saltator]|uniref:Zinc finger protein Helios n=1 Tax=Harpegnathos saltator TaxID=610380 RepID=E2BJA2_HARSA|nr:Zinc finger protein Helios [Harpegnathos saltator]